MQISMRVGVVQAMALPPHYLCVLPRAGHQMIVQRMQPCNCNSQIFLAGNVPPAAHCLEPAAERPTSVSLLEQDEAGAPTRISSSRIGLLARFTILGGAPEIVLSRAS